MLSSTHALSPANLDQGTWRPNIATLPFVFAIFDCRCLSLAASFACLAFTLARNSSVTSLSSKQPSWKVSSSRRLFFSICLAKHFLWSRRRRAGAGVMARCAVALLHPTATVSRLLLSQATSLFAFLFGCRLVPLSNLGAFLQCTLVRGQPWAKIS